MHAQLADIGVALAVRQDERSSLENDLKELREAKRNAEAQLSSALENARVCSSLVVHVVRRCFCHRGALCRLWSTWQKFASHALAAAAPQLLRDAKDDLELRLKLQAAQQQRTENALKEVKAQLARKQLTPRLMNLCMSAISRSRAACCVLRLRNGERAHVVLLV